MTGLYIHPLNADSTGVKDRDVKETVESMGSKLMHAYFKHQDYTAMAVGKILHDHLP